MAKKASKTTKPIKRTSKKVTPPKTSKPLYTIVSFCVLVPEDTTAGLTKIRAAVISALSAPKATKSLRINWDKRVGRGGVLLDEPFHQKD